MQSKILMSGLTSGPIVDLVPVAKAWLTPAKIEVAGSGFKSEGYDPAQRAYVLARSAGAAGSSVELTLEGSADSPVVNPALVVRGWGEGKPLLRVDGKPVEWGKGFRFGLVRGLEETDLVVWIQKQSTQPVKLTVIPAK
jgi:hypothetical protein